MSAPNAYPLMRPIAMFAVALAFAATPVACSANATRAEPTKTPGPAAAVTTIAPTTTAKPEPSHIATAKAGVREIVVHSSPAGPVERLDIAGDGKLADAKIANPTATNVSAAFLVKQLSLSQGGESWSEVYLPVRPNGSTGWIRDADVDMTATQLSLHIALAAHSLTINDGNRPLISYRIAVGTPINPTPTGLFYVKELVAPDNPDGAYGPLAYGLSGHSDSIKDSQEFADGVIAIHGTDHPELIGSDVSHGCIRMENSDILDLQSHEIPVGAPVTIAA